MFTHEDLRDMQTRSLKMQGWIREQTFSPESEKVLRRFSSWEVSELILGMNQSTFRGRLAADPTFPAGKVEPEGRQRWFSSWPCTSQLRSTGERYPMFLNKFMKFPCRTRLHVGP